MRRAILVLPLVLAALAVGVAQVGAAPACSITWVGPTSGGTWSTAANWNLNRLPTDADHVCIPAGSTVIHSSGTTTIATLQAPGTLSFSGGTLTLASTTDPSNLGALQQSGGTLTGAGTLVLAGASTWTGGQMAGSGKTVVPSGVTLTQSTNSPQLWDTRTLEVAGVLDLATADRGIFRSGTPLVHVLSGGVLRKSAGATGFVDPALENDGSVVATVAGGTLELNNGTGAGESTGDFGGPAAAGTVLLDGGEHKLGDGAALLGAARISGGTATVTGTVTASGANAMSGGTLTGAGRLEVDDAFTWTGGQMAGAGTTHVLPGATLTVQTNSPQLWDTRVLEVAGLMELVTADRGLFRSGTPLLHVMDGGILRKTGAGTGFIDPALDNDGLVEATAGTFELNNGSGGRDSTGTFGGPGLAGVTMLDGGDHVLGDGATLAGSARISGGTVTVTGGASASGANTMTGGTLTGPGLFAVAGTFDWSGGQMAGTGTTRLAAGATLTLLTNSPQLWDTRTLEVGGTMLLSTADRGLFRSGTPRVHVLSTGLLRKSSGGTGFVDPAVENDGQIEATVGGGVLELNNGGGSGQSTGTFGAAGAAGLVRLDAGTFSLGDGADLLAGSRIAGATVDVVSDATAVADGSAMSSGTLTGAGLFSIGGPFAWSGGSMTGAGRTRVEPGAVVTHSTNSTSLGPGRTLENAGVIDFTADRGIFESFGDPVPLLHNLPGGVLRKTGGTGTTELAPRVRNDGQIESTSGLLELDRGASEPHTGTFKGASENAHVVLGDGFSFELDHILGAGTDLEGVVESAGSVQVADGATQLVDDTLVLTSGRLTGEFDVAGLLRWTGGDMAGPGTTTVLAGGELVGDDACGVSLEDGRRMVNAGLMRLVRGTTLSGFGDPRSEIENTGTLRLDGSEAGTCGDDVGIGGDVLVHNTGTIEKTGSAPARIDGVLDNDGALSVTGGGLALASDEALVHDGSFGASGGATLTFDFGTFVLGPAASLSGDAVIEFADVVVPAGTTLSVPAANTLTIAGGSLGGDGDLEVDGTLAWRDGSLEGRGTTVIEPGGRALVGAAEFDISRLGENHVLVNRGEVVVASESLLSQDEGSTILNAGMLELQGTAGIEGDDFFGFGVETLLHNTGVVRKTGAGVAEAETAIDNDGTLEVLAGTLTARGLLNYSTEDDSLNGGAYVVRNATLHVRGGVETNAARIVLDGTTAQLRASAFSGGTESDALVALARNAAAGVLELAGGRSLTVPALVNAGTLQLGAGSTLSTTGGYRQLAGAVLRPAVTAGGVGRVAASGPAQLGGRLDSPAAPPLAGDHLVLSAPSIGGAFATVSGGYAAHVTATQVRLRPPAGLLRTAAAPEPAEPVPAAGDALEVEGPWQRHRAVLSAARRGAQVAVRGVRGRELALVARTCRRCGSVRVRWAGRTRTVSLRGRRGRRTIRVFSSAGARTGTVRIKAVSARRVAVRAVLVR
jgi:hypothetical protein